jgi:hypothetical protein
MQDIVNPTELVDSIPLFPIASLLLQRMELHPKLHLLWNFPFPLALLASFFKKKVEPLCRERHAPVPHSLIAPSVLFQIRNPLSVVFGNAPFLRLTLEEAFSISVLRTSIPTKMQTGGAPGWKLA